MNARWRYICLVLFMVLVLPGLVFSVIYLAWDKDQLLTLPQENEGYFSEPLSQDFFIKVKDQGKVKEMALNAYIVGVVLREMPSDFEEEALKAQAVVARTYALRHQLLQDKHSDAAVCTDSDCCQGYWDEKLFLSEGGKMQQLEKVRNAVKSTSNLVLYYGGELIEATYFSCSGGLTEDALAVWGSDIPYLQSVESPGEEQATHYTDTVSFYVHEFASRLGIEPVVDTRNWVSNVLYTDGGGVQSIQVGDVVFQGTAFRKLLDLRSTAFYITALGNKVTITTKGFGHRVGMSQYGAEAMAVQGSTFPQILHHYYQCVALREYQG